jgi:hypothetical protein
MRKLKISQRDAGEWITTGKPPPADKVDHDAHWFVDSIWTASKSAKGEAPANRRKRLAAGLIAVRELVGLFDGEMARDLADLSSALTDLDRGSVHPMLKPVKKSRGAPYDSDKWRAYTYLALAMHAWMRCRMSQEEAAKRVARRSPVDIRHKQIQSWRKEIMAGRRNTETLDLFSRGRRVIESLSTRPQLEAFALWITSQAHLISDLLT